MDMPSFSATTHLYAGSAVETFLTALLQYACCFAVAGILLIPVVWLAGTLAQLLLWTGGLLLCLPWTAVRFLRTLFAPRP